MIHDTVIIFLTMIRNIDKGCLNTDLLRDVLLLSIFVIFDFFKNF